MFNGVPLRRVRGIVRHYYVNMEVFGKLNQLLLEKPAGTAVGTSTITEQHDGSCMWIDALEHTIPVVLEVVAGELGCRRLCCRHLEMHRRGAAVCTGYYRCFGIAQRPG